MKHLIFFFVVLHFSVFCPQSDGVQEKRLLAAGDGIESTEKAKRDVNQRRQSDDKVAKSLRFEIDDSDYTKTVAENAASLLNAAADAASSFAAVRFRQDDGAEEWTGETEEVKDSNKPSKRSTSDNNKNNNLALPIWAIVLITFSCFLILVCCCLCCCSILQLQEEDKRRGYQKRRHSAKEFVIILVPGKRDQIYKDYEARQASGRADDNASRMADASGQQQQPEQPQQPEAQPGADQGTPLITVDQGGAAAAADAPASAPAPAPARAGGKTLKKK